MWRAGKMAEDADDPRSMELRRLEAEGQRLAGENQRLRSELRRARASASIASTLHQEIFASQRCHPVAADAEVSAESEACLLEQLQRAETETSQRTAEVAELNEKLAAQEALDAEAAGLVAELEGRGRAGKSSGTESLPGELEPCVPTVREVKLVRETDELRQRVAFLERRVEELRASQSASGSPGPASSRDRQTVQQLGRGDVRRLQQLDSVALRLHEELRRRGTPAHSAAASAASSPGQRRSAAQPPSVCGTSVSKLSTKSEVLDGQLEAFYNRFMVRRAGLGAKGRA